MTLTTTQTPTDRLSLIGLAEAHYNRELVKVCHDRISAIPWPANTAKPMSLQLPEPTASNQIASICFILAMTSINYRFWRRLPDGSLVRYHHLGKSGARALWGAFEAAWGPTINPGTELSKRLHAGEFTTLFGDMSDQQGRLDILAEILEPEKLPMVAEILFNEIQSSKQVTVTQAAGLAMLFPRAFDDPFLKKAQLALSMVAAYLRSTEFEVDVSDLTAFSDYQVPRVLRALAVIDYCPSLADKVDRNVILEEGGPEEQAIRAATITACESIAKHTGGTAADIDNLLWLSQDIAEEARFHLTETRLY